MGVGVGAEAAVQEVASSRRDRTSGIPLGMLGKPAVAEEEEGRSGQVR